MCDFLLPTSVQAARVRYMKRLIMTQLQQWKNFKNRKPLVLDGVRQVGKTYSLQELGKDFNNCHYFNLEKDINLHKIFSQDLDPTRIIADLELVSNRSIDRKKDLLIFDEIQECPKALTSLKYFNEEMTDLAICSAGSLLGVHLNQGSFPVGKVDILRMHPLNFKEFLIACNEEKVVQAMDQAQDKPLPVALHDKLWNLLKHYFVVGGMPEVVKAYIGRTGDLLAAFTRVRSLQEGLYKGYLADMAKHSGKVNAMHLERVFKAVPEQLSKEQDSSAKRFQFKNVVPNVKEYRRLASSIDWLEKAGMIVKVSIANQALLPFSAYCKESMFKLFAFDVGMLGAISNLSPQTILNYEYGSYKGYFAENFVLQELFASGLGPLYSWQESKAQVEFLLEKDDQIIPIEVKAGNSTKAQSLGVFAKKYSPPYRVKVTGKPQSESNDGSLKNCPLYLAGFYLPRC